MFLYPKDIKIIRTPNNNFNIAKIRLFNLINKINILRAPIKAPNINLINFTLYFKIIDIEYSTKKSQKKLIKSKMSI